MVLGPLLVLCALFFGLRGAYVSDLLKQKILPELQSMLGLRVTAERIYLNIFPLFIEARRMKVTDEKGQRLMELPRVKAYLELTGLFDRRLTIRRLVVRDPGIDVSRKQVEAIAENIRHYLATTRKDALKVKVRAVEVKSGTISLADEQEAISVVLKEFGGEAILGEAARVLVTSEDVTVRKKGMPDLTAGVTAGVLIRDGAIEIRKLTADSLGSRLGATGKYEAGRGKIMTDLSLMMDSLKKAFGLKRSGEGSVTAHGAVNFTKGVVSLDLDLKGSFYIQTLMEFLKVKEKLEGYVTLKGRLKGPLNKLVGDGTGELRSGNLFDVNVDFLKCRISYADRRMRFSEGIGRLYNGSATVNASIALPVVNHYTLDIGFRNVDSKAVFRLIGWDPGLMSGKVKGTLVNDGSSFDPEGQFEYRSSATGKNVLGRVREVSGRYVMKHGLVSIAGLQMNTGISTATMAGTADLKRKILDFEGGLKSPDLVDATGPYFNTVHGAGEFRGRIAGPFADPEITGQVKISNPSIAGYGAGQLTAGIGYRKDRLTISSLTATGREDSYSLSGTIGFRSASALFDFKAPEYDLRASIRGADLKKFAALFYRDFHGDGRLNTDLTIGGGGMRPLLTGQGAVDNGRLYGVPFETASFGWRYDGTDFDLTAITLRKGRSVLTGALKINESGRFDLSAVSERLYLNDLLDRKIRGEALFTLKAEGHGTSERHRIVVTAEMVEGRLRDKPVGGGSATAEIHDRDLVFNASVLDGRVTATGRGRLEKEFPWNARVEVHPGRYDNVISAFLKDVPEDLVLSVNGDITLNGDRNRISAVAAVKQANLSMYGYGFTNDREIRLELNNRRLKLDHVTMRSGNARVLLNGGLEIGRSYNLAVEGTTGLSPFKSLSAKIGIMKGDADFDLDITGDWENPSVNGNVNLRDGAFSLKDFSYRISGLNGHMYLDNDRVVLENLSGKLGGGDVDLSGILYLKKFLVRRFFVEAAVNNISASVSPDFSLNFGGNLLYKGTPEDQMISGDIRINRARYKERVEWKSWLLKTKQPEKVRSEVSIIEKARLNVHVIGKESIRIDNNIARADLSADLLLRGTLYRPALLGRLESKEGTVYFRNNEFRILHASADFTDEARLNPVISIAAETIVKGYKIKMNLEGRMNQFAMSLSSDPVLKEMDILSLLTVGQTAGQLKGLEGGVGAGEATSFVTGKLQDVVEERLRSITGLDRFQVDPHVSRITGTVEPRVTVSKRLLGDKVFVTYTSAAGTEEEQIIKVEYFVNRNVSIVGIRDERGILGGDVKLRFEFK